jgi:hypothetical protein
LRETSGYSRVRPQMVQLENDVFSGQLFQGGVLGKGGVPALRD